MRIDAPALRAYSPEWFFREVEMILIIGAGAVGTTLGSYLSVAGQSVRMLVRDAEHYRQATQLVVEGTPGKASLVVPRPEITSSLDLSDVTYVFICVKHAALTQVLEQLPVPLPADVTLVSTLNGVSALAQMRSRYPDASLANMTIMFNAQLLGPLHTRMMSYPQVIIDTQDPKLATLFQGSAMQVKQTQGLANAWGKLLINLSNAICAITHSTMMALISQPDLKRIYVAALDEAVSLLKHAGIDYHFPMPLPYQLYRQLLLNGGSLAWRLAKLKNGLEEGSYPSMVIDVAAGRLTEVEQINGELETLARAHHLPTPINDQLISLVRSFAGQSPPPYLSPAELLAKLGLKR